MPALSTDRPQAWRARTSAHLGGAAALAEAVSRGGAGVRGATVGVAAAGEGVSAVAAVDVAALRRVQAAVAAHGVTARDAARRGSGRDRAGAVGVGVGAAVGVAG